MAKETNAARLIRALQARGETIITDVKARRYVVLTRSNPPSSAERRPWYWYVGSKGALRTGTTVAGAYPEPNWVRILLRETE